MRWLSRVASALRNLLRRGQVEGELDEELSGFVALLEQEKIRQGMTPEAAHRAALVEAGGTSSVKDEVRDARAGALIETFLQDLRYGARSLRRTPGFTVAAVLALALGIGASAAIFSVVDAVLLRPLPYAEPGRLMIVMHHTDNPVAPANYLDWKREAKSFDAMGGASYWTPGLTGDRPERLLALHVTSDVPRMLGVQPLLGRLFTPQNDEPGHEFEAILSYGLWQSHFAGDPRVLGRAIILDGRSHTVIGVMPQGYAFPPFWAVGAQLWAPLSLEGRTSNRGGNFMRVFAHLAPGVSVAMARAEMDGITARLEQMYPGTNRQVTVTPLNDVVVGRVRPAIRMLLGAVICVLLIACANVAHMLLARSAAREREIAVRVALGAGRGRVMRQLLTESVLLALAGGGAGLLLAVAGTRALVRLGAGSIPRAEGVSVNGTVLLVTVLITLLTGLLFGLAPAFQASTGNLFSALRDGARTSASAGRQRLRSALIVSEFALALMLLAGAGLLVRSFMALRSVDPGWNPDHTVSMVVTITGSTESQLGHRVPFFRQLLQQVRAMPGVRAAGAINHLPLAGDIWGWPYNVEGREIARPGDAPVAVYRVVMPGYFETMGLRLLKGRDISDADDQSAPGVVIVSQWLAEHRWPGEHAIGKRLTLDFGAGARSWLTVVGVAHDAAQSEWGGTLNDEIYLPYAQNTQYLESPGAHVGYLTLVVRADGDALALIPQLRQAVWALDKDLPISEVQSLGTAVSVATAQPRFYLVLLVCFAVVAVSLAAVGIYGVMSYQVTRRSGEIGVRMALGARRGDVVRMIVRQGMGLALGGAAFGLVGAFALSRVMATLLYGVGATDPVTFVGVAVLLTVVALAASAVPAWRASRIDPQTALRCE